MANVKNLPCDSCGALMWSDYRRKGPNVCTECRSTKTCIQCGGSFQSSSVRALACSDACRRRRRTDQQLARDRADLPTARARQKACNDKRRQAAQHPCLECGKNLTGGDICRACASARGVAKARALAAQRPPKPPKKPAPRLSREELEQRWQAQRSDLRAAYEDRDPDRFFSALLAKSEVTPDGCWQWTGKTTKRSSGSYPIAHWGRKVVGMHRASLEMKHGADLGSQPAHHVCANSTCVNPEHLQPVTHRENLAEMMARQTYLTRIRELEKALEQVDPSNPLLHIIAVA